MDDCIFCKIIRRELPAHIIDENDLVIVFLSLENHPLIVTKQHVNDLYSLNDDQAAAVMQTAVKIAKATKRSLACDGINLLQANGSAAQQDVFHFHLHIKPRWYNDSVILHWETDEAHEEARRQTLDKIRQSLSLPSQ
jgi:histidine triad (HIT) family protein